MASTTDTAKLLASKMLRTSAFHRPSPSLFFFPGLNTRPFHRAADFRFTSDFENNLPTLQKEYWQLREAYGDDRDDYAKKDGEHTLNKGTWKWMNYIERGNRINQQLWKEHCPVTTQLLEQSIGSQLMTGTPFSYTFYSTMSPQASIAPHYGACNLKLRCHFPLFVPEESFLRVAGDPRPWEEGKMIIFDDSYEHEAANLSLEKERVILLIDIWHPDLVPGEIHQIQGMFTQVEQMIRQRKAEQAATKTQQ